MARVIRQLSILVALAVTGGVLAASPAGARPTWQPVTNLFADLSAPGGSAQLPDVAVDRDGDATAVWARFNGTVFVIQGSTRPAGGTWSAPVDLSRSGDAREPRVAVDDAGHAAVVWRRYDGTTNTVQAVTRAPDGTWSAPVDLSVDASVFLGDRPGAPQVALDQDGDVTAVWPRYDGARYTVQTATRPAGGDWGSPVDLSAPGRSALEPQLALDPSGAATVLWATGGGQGVVQASTRPAGGAWSAPVDVSTPGGAAYTMAYGPQLAVDPAGAVTAVWGHFNGANYVVQSSTRPSGGAWTSPVTLSPQGQDVSWDPQVAVDASGAATAVWRRTDGEHWIVVAASRPASGTWTSAEDVSDAGQATEDPRVAVDPKGNATVIWSRNDDGSRMIQAATRPVGGVWTAPHDLSTPGGDARLPAIALDPEGNATTAWSRLDGASWIVQARGLDAAGPVVTALTAPPEASSGQAVAYSVTAHDVWSDVRSVVWDFGDGTTATGSSVTHVSDEDRARPVKVTLTDTVGNTTTCTTTCTSSTRAVPEITRLRLRPRRIEVKGPRKKTRTHVVLRLSEDARVRVTLKPLGKKGKAAKQRTVLRKRLDAGRSRLRLTSKQLTRKLGRRHFTPGRYRLTVTAATTEGRDRGSVTLRVRP